MDDVAGECKVGLVMEFSNEYLDLWDRPTSLTAEEIAYFRETVECVKKALGVEVEIINRDHYREMDGKHREAHGIFYTNDTKAPAKDCLITIDNLFIHDCYREKFHGEFNLNFESLEHVICHEIAHMSQFRHCKKHSKLTEELYEKVQAYQKDKERELARDLGENGMERTKGGSETVMNDMKIVDSYDVNGGSHFYSVELAENRFVDVKVCPDSGLVYVMENEDGSTVYTGEWAPGATVPGYAYDEKEVVRFVKEVYEKEYGMQSLDGLIKESEMKRFDKAGHEKEKGMDLDL